MRSTPWLFILLIGTVALVAGCSQQENASTHDAEAPGPLPRGWASDERAVPVETARPDAKPPATTTQENASNHQPKTGDNPPKVVWPAESAAEKEPKPLPPDAFATPPEASEPPPQENSAIGPEPAAPHNPLRGRAPAPDAANPMRGPAAPLPGGETQNAAQGEPPIATEPAAPLKTPLPSADTPATARTDESPAASSPGKPSSESSSDKPADDAAKNAEPAEEPFDPIKENGPIFVDWPKPRLAIVITGREDGYLEPCGCAGLEKMKGGLSRRHTMIKGLIAKGWPVVRVDAGGLTKGYGRQTEIKFQITVEAMRKIGYDAIGFGANDLRLPAAELVSVAADPASPFVSANVGLFELESGLTARTKIAEAGGLKIGVTAVLGTKYQSEINNQEIQFSPPEEAIAKVLPELKKTCNLLILLAHATREESIALGKRFRDFQLVVTSDSPAEPPAEATRIPGTDSLLIEVGEKGMNAVVVGLYNDPQKPLRYQRVPLDSRFAASKDMYRLMVAYQEQLKRQGLEGLGVRAIDHPQAELNGPFVGSEKCKSCHEESYRIWKKSGHAKGWKTLVELDPPRNFDPECISCHVVGWHPTRYFPYKTGFLSEKQTPEMVNIGCETCHGPGGAHCDAEDGSDLALQEKLQIAVRVTKEESQTNLSKMCQNCHDLDNSPAFKFETYWPKVEHYEEE